MRLLGTAGAQLDRGANSMCVFLRRAAVDEQNAQTQQQLFPLNQDEEEGLVEEEEEEEETEADKTSLQSSYSVKQRNPRRGQWSFNVRCEGRSHLQCRDDKLTGLIRSGVHPLICLCP